MALALLLCLQQQVEMKAHESFYLLHAPAAYTDRTSWPVVVALHGEGDAGRELGQWAELAERAGCLVAAPQARGTGWGKGKASSDGAFVRACLDDVKTRYRVDPERVLLAGYGNGADYVFALGAAQRTVYAACAPFLRLTEAEVEKGPPCFIVAGADEPSRARGFKAQQRLQDLEVVAKLRPTGAAAGEFPPREEYAAALEWFARTVRPRGDLARVDEYVKELRYLDATLVLAGLLGQPGLEGQLRWQFNRIEGRGLIELGKVEIAISEKRYVDAWIRCREAAVQYAWVPVGEKIRRRLSEMESDARVKRALERKDE